MVSTPWGDFTPDVCRLGTVLSAEALALNERVWFFAKATFLAGEPLALAGASALTRALADGFRPAPATAYWGAAPDQVVELLEQAIHTGRVQFRAISALRIRVEATQAQAAAPSPASPVAQTEQKTRFEVKLLDEVGEAVDGVELVFSAAGRRETKTTDGSGTAKFEDAESSFCSLSFKDEAALREKLKARWQQARDKDWYHPPEGEEATHTLLQVRRQSELVSPTLVAEEPHTVVFQPRVTQALLTGLWFATSKSFLLPTARHSLQRLKQLYEQNPETDLLIVGHTDRAGTPSYNDPLSLERAQSVADYLADKVDAWYQWYGSSKPSEKRWGGEEDQLMIEAVADDSGETIPADQDPVRWYQESRGLTVDGDAGEQTRTALITEYMALDGTTLPADIRMSVHGCGENFPLEPTADGEAEQINRRVEIFFFENPMRPPERPDAILPPPPGANSAPGSKEYPEWVKRTQETYELGVGRWIRLLLKYEDGTPAKNVNVTVRHSDSETVAPTNDRGVLMIHGVDDDTWSLIDIDDGSEVIELT